jgi:hypothetical protein
MKTELVISEREPRGDLTESVARALREDGEYVAHQDDRGRKLVAHVSNGAIVEWAAFDEDGREVTTVVVRQPDQNPPAEIAARAGTRWAIVCACYESGDFCWWQPY